MNVSKPYLQTALQARHAPVPSRTRRLSDAPNLSFLSAQPSGLSINPPLRHHKAIFSANHRLRHPWSAVCRQRFLSCDFHFVFRRTSNQILAILTGSGVKKRDSWIHTDALHTVKKHLKTQQSSNSLLHRCVLLCLPFSSQYSNYFITQHACDINCTRAP